MWCGNRVPTPIRESHTICNSLATRRAPRQNCVQVTQAYPTVPRRTDEIQPGFYRFRKARNGPWVAAEITVANGRIRVAENGDAPTLEVTQEHFAEVVTEQISEGAAFNHPLLRVVWFGDPISEREHAYLVRRYRWARAHAPDHPDAQQGRPIDLGQLPIDYIV